ncbi:MAG TPA: TIGR03618 family F420-dependent PPOX class oxidoreductase [Gaiellaceae bacterium]|nr:TIGR03618 family F420-dependent PPOX class oxidoreductase [Gaiellaceae bacterium]
MADLTGTAREAFEAPRFWALATVNPDGSPQSTTVWAHTRDGKIIVNTALGRKKPRNLETEPRVALSTHWDDDGGYHSISVQGRVAEKVTGDQAEQDIDDLAQKYIGQTPYPWRQPGEERVTYVIEPTHVHSMG